MAPLNLSRRNALQMLGATAGFGVAGPWAWCRPPG
ncbi:MAG: twin-arginine translocation signal domain-containing protein [Vulcanococcus sp.]|nr:twin-arginine translocation signal domain-containing protein [Vulcanococcus sp.]